MNQALLETDTTTILGKPYNVILFDDQSHSMDEVLQQVNRATGCGVPQAFQIMMEAHSTGRAIAFSGGKERCEHVESILAEIGLGTKIEQA